MSRRDLRILWWNRPSSVPAGSPSGEEERVDGHRVAPRRLSRRSFLRLGAAGLMLAGAASCGVAPVLAPQPRVNFYNLSNYIAPTTIPGFEREYGVKVTYDNYSAQDTLEAKLRIGHFGYDLVVASDFKISHFSKLGLIQPLDHRRLPNLGHLFGWLREAPYDPGNRWSVPWQWGTTGVGYNQQYVKEPVDSWRVLWNPTFHGRIDMLNEKRDCIAIALVMLGHSVNSVDPGELRQAQEALIAQKALLKHYTSDTYIDEMAAEDAWLCEAWSGDVFQAMADNPSVRYAIPAEGSFIWVDNLCIPTAAPHKELAELFINYVLEPQVGADISNAVEFATPNEASLPLIRPDLRNNPLVYPPPSVTKKLAFLEDLGPHELLWNRVWETVKLST